MWADIETSQDLLGYQVHADLLRKIILDKNMLPISIGIFGNWGSGKSSLMLLLKQSVDEWIKKTEKDNESCKEDNQKENTKILQIQFNSWQFENYENTKLTLIETILDSIAKEIESRRSIFEKCDEVLSRIKYLSAGILILKKLASKFIPQQIKDLLPTKEELKDLIEEKDYESLIQEINIGNTSKFISRFRKSLEELIKSADYRGVIVYIDDLDRCIPERVIDCLEAVKLFLNVKSTAFVIGADERIIEYAISKHYPIEKTKDTQLSPFSDYLEKLIQLPYKLPKLSFSEQETYILLLLCSKNYSELQFKDIHAKFLEFRKSDKHTKYDIKQLNKDLPSFDITAIKDYLPIIPLMLRFLNGNPRQIKRFMNTFDVRMKMANVAGFTDVKPDILVKLMVLEYNPLYRNRFEELYVAQRFNNGIIKDFATVEQQAMDGAIKETKWEEGWSSELLINWLKSEPHLDNVNMQNYFWIARDSIKDNVPIENLISNKVRLLFEKSYSLSTRTTLKTFINNRFVQDNMDSGERDMFVLILNQALKKNITDKQIWRILNSDENNKIIENCLDRLKLLFSDLDIKNIDAQAAEFIKMMNSVNAEFSSYIQTLDFKISLEKAIKTLG